jgi:Kef-type K+ transport system membrane component KefB
MDRPEHTIPELDRKGLREFGLVTGAIVAVLFGLFFPWLLERSFPFWPWAIFAALGAWAFVAPLSLQLVYRAWMRLGLLLSKVTTPIIMGLVFYVVITPFALILKVASKDPMRRKFDGGDTYRITCGKVRADSLEHPY